MPAKRLFTDEQAREMRKLAAEGMTGAQLARKFRCSATTISHYLADGNEPRPARARQAIDEFVAGLGDLEGERRALAAVAGVLADRVDGARAAGSAAVAAKTLADLVATLARDVRRAEDEARAREALQAIGLA